MELFIAFGATALAFLLLDFAWLGAMANRLYRPRLRAVMGDKVVWPPAVAFYLIYIAGMSVIAVAPAIAAADATRALITGAMLGFMAYATYNLTNWSTLKAWSAAVAIADMSWGTAATALASYAGAWAALSFA
ncbi:DUF2177 family protein [Terricaulis sp.]|uniref:DUF2177 family protein n=1 Tax=Terricaulis sp. TaxID=2768686 RepID=UPI0037844AF3